MSEFYAQAGWELPLVERTTAADVPATAAPVLAHEDEMTARLEAHHDTAVGIRVLARARRGDVYAREVLLTRADDERPLALAAAEVRLDMLPGALVAAILAEQEPLGRILRRRAALSRSRHEYFRLQLDEHVHRAFGAGGSAWAYGRSGALVDTTGRAVASVVEIVPPRS